MKAITTTKIRSLRYTWLTRARKIYLIGKLTPANKFDEMQQELFLSMY